MHANRVLDWLVVVSLTTASGNESVACVERTSREIGFAEFKEDARDSRMAEFVESSKKEGRGDAFATEIGMNGNIKYFRFAGEFSRSDEADE